MFMAESSAADEVVGHPYHKKIVSQGITRYNRKTYSLIVLVAFKTTKIKKTRIYGSCPDMKAFNYN